MIGKFLIQGDFGGDTGRIYLKIEVKGKEIDYDMSPDTARRIGEALVKAAKDVSMNVALRRGSYVTNEN